MIQFNNSTIDMGPDLRNQVLLELAKAIQEVAKAVSTDNRTQYGIYVQNPAPDGVKLETSYGDYDQEA